MKTIGIITILVLILTSCKEAISVNISDSTPVMILPQVNDTVAENPVYFKWEEVEGATKYHLQIVSPNFNNITTYPVDSMVSGTSIYISLDSNKYELMLTAVNEGYTSHTLGPIAFSVGIQPSASAGTVVLTSPVTDTYFNEDFSGLFSWQTLSGASSYEYSVRKGTSYASSNIIETAGGIVTNQYTLAATLDEGEYHWGVKAYLSAGGETMVSTRRFYIDTINPLVSTLISPSTSVPTGATTFTWSTGTDPGTIHAPVTATVEVAEDANFTVGVLSTTSTGTTATISLSGTGLRFWRVKNTDAAGNESAYSTSGQFTLM